MGLFDAFKKKAAPAPGPQAAQLSPFQRLKAAAEAGDAEAMYKVAMAYLMGEGVAEDEAQYQRWVLRAAQAGSTDAMCAMGEDCAGDGDMAAAEQWYRKAAAAGDREAMEAFAAVKADIAGETGAEEAATDEVWKTYADADVERLLRAARQGDARSAYLAAMACYDGDGTLLAWEECAQWILRAAESGYAPAQYQLGEFYGYGGCSLTEDEAKSRFWHEKAAAQGNTKAMRELGSYCAWDGDMAAAEQWYRKAVAAGDENAMEAFAETKRDIAQGSDDPAVAIPALTEAAAGGDEWAMYRLGEIYQQGEGVEKDEEKAAEYFRQAAQKGNAKAQYELGMCYLLGRGTREDLTHAWLWMQRAADKDHVQAQYQVGKMYANNVHTAPDKLRAYLWLEVARRNGSTEAEGYLELLDVEMKNPIPIQVSRIKLEAMNGDYPPDQLESILTMMQLHLKGDGVHFSDVSATEWCEKAAMWELKFPNERMPSGVQRGQCLYWLGVDCLNGFGRDSYDAKSALQWLEKSAQRGYGPAMHLLGELHRIGHGVEADPEAAVAWYRKGMEVGDIRSTYALAMAYRLGEGVESDASRYMELLRDAADRGHSRACYTMFCLHMDGVLPEDRAVSNEYLRRATIGYDALAGRLLDQTLEQQREQ